MKTCARGFSLRLSGKILNFLKLPGRIIYAMFIMACLTVLVGCAASGKRIRTGSLRTAGISGSFTLILYGGNYSDDLETVAFLDREGDDYTFDIFAPEFNYRIFKGVSAVEGIKRAEEFVAGHSSFHQFKVSRILDEESQVIGYEVRPLYLPFTYGTDDVLDVWYAAKENKIVITIRLKPSIENIKMRDDIRHE